MDLLLVILAGLGAALGAVLGPGMLNMNVIKTRLSYGKRAALIFAAGIMTVFAAQASVGVIGGQYLGINQAFIEDVKVYAIPVFFALALFFFYRGYRKTQEDDDEEDEDDAEENPNHYLRGLSLAVMNLLAIPYFYGLTVWLFQGGTLTNTLITRIVFVATAAVGAYGVFTAYALAAPWVKRNARPITRNISFLIGGLLFLGASVQSYRMFFAEG